MSHFMQELKRVLLAPRGDAEGQGRASRGGVGAWHVEPILWLLSVKVFGVQSQD